jgi:Zn-dependent protease
MAEQPWELQDEPSPTENHYIEVAKEIEKLQTEEPSRRGLFLFPVSAIAFFLIINADLQLKQSLIIMAVIFLHEVGHYLAMKIFGYRDLKIFFIPFFGAATTGQNWCVESWKRAVVDLAGPIPGIFLGTLLYILAIQYPELSSTLKPYIFPLILLNVFNLFPIAHLDGANFLAHINQVRFPLLGAAIKSVSLILLGITSPGLFLLFGLSAALMAYEEYIELEIARSVMNKYPQWSNKPKLDQDFIEIICSHIQSDRQDRIRPRNMAARVLRVFEHISKSPPSFKQSLFLNGIYLSGLLIAYLVLSKLDFNILSFLNGITEMTK